MALGIPVRLRPRIFSTFCTTSVVVRQANAPAAFTPGEIPDTHFQRLSRPQGTWFIRKDPKKKSQVTPQKIDPGTVRLVAQRCPLELPTSALCWRSENAVNFVPVRSFCILFKLYIFVLPIKFLIT